MESLETVVSLLRHRGSRELANLLSRAELDFIGIDEGFTLHGDNMVTISKAMIVAPISDYDRLVTLSKGDNELILRALQELWPYDEQGGGILITDVSYRLDSNSLIGDSQDVDVLLEILTHIRHVMVDVSTGGRAINEVNPEFKEAYSQLTSRLMEKGMRNPVPYSDLWDWYGKWSSGDLPTYRSRREYIKGLFEPIERRIREGSFAADSSVFPEPTGWSLVDRQLGEVRSRLQAASTEEQFQAVGFLCRETLISLGQTVFNPESHPAIDDVKDVSKTDAKRMLDRYLAAEVTGRANALARKQARGSLELANELQHHRIATFREAALCAETTAFVVNLIAIVSGVRDP